MLRFRCALKLDKVIPMSADSMTDEKIGSLAIIMAASEALKSLFKWGGISLIAYFGFDAFKAFAGETTALSFASSLIFKTFLDIKYVFSISIGGLGFILYWRERKLKRRAIRRLSTRIKELELHIDPNRSSSKLNPDGTTNLKDVLQ